MVKNQCHSKNDTQTATSKMTVRRFGLKFTGKIVGSTHFLAIDCNHRTVNNLSLLPQPCLPCYAKYRRMWRKADPKLAHILRMRAYLPCLLPDLHYCLGIQWKSHGSSIFISNNVLMYLWGALPVPSLFYWHAQSKKMDKQPKVWKIDNVIWKAPTAGKASLTVE